MNHKLLLASLLCLFCIWSCSKGHDDAVILQLNDNVEISGECSDIISVVPGEYTLKKAADEANADSPTVLIKLTLKRTAAKAEGFVATSTGWSVHLTGEDGQQLTAGELKLQKGPSDDSEAEKLTKWVNEAGEGDTETFLFTVVADNVHLANYVIENAKGLMLKTGHKQNSGSTITAAPANEEGATENDNSSLQASSFSFSGSLSGWVGGFWGNMNITSGSGWIDLDGGGERTLKVKSISGSKLVINAYLRGKYIGYYSGTVSYDGGERYKGVFHNTVKGGKVSFDLR